MKKAQDWNQPCPDKNCNFYGQLNKGNIISISTYMILISDNYMNEPPNFVFMEILFQAMVFLNGNGQNGVWTLKRHQQPVITDQIFTKPLFQKNPWLADNLQYGKFPIHSLAESSELR